MIDVVAALIRRGGRVLLCRRPEGKERAGKWEFPGGKIEAGESGESALARECREELGVELAVGKALASVVHAYPDCSVRLTLCEATVLQGEPRRLEHSELRWVPAYALPSFDLCAADARLVSLLQGKL